MVSRITRQVIFLCLAILPVLGKSSPCLWQGELKKNYPRNISARFDFKWFSGFREELFKIAQVKLGRKHPWKVLYKDC
jgi:hypothetical protein